MNGYLIVCHVCDGKKDMAINRQRAMIILYCNGRTYKWTNPYYISDRLACNECEWIVPGTDITSEGK